ncbi:MAG: N-acetyltransferase, partial [Actinobacteria bacterium]|nr:N-acetyltransferase [Actinomycetota bacterium]
MVHAPAAQLVPVDAGGVTLREYRPDDQADLLAALADHEIARWNPGPTGPHAAEEFMRSRNDWSGTDHASWAVADASDRLVGSVSLHEIDADQADAEIGYWIAPWA